MDIKKQISAKEKAFNVVNSCKTYEQCQTASNFLNNYLELTEDGFGYNLLVTILNDITNDINEQIRLKEYGEIDE